MKTCHKKKKTKRKISEKRHNNISVISLLVVAVSRKITYEKVEIF